jgi:homoserine acetyltransferase
MQRRILMADPHWRGGEYYGREFPYLGLKHARCVVCVHGFVCMTNFTRMLTSREIATIGYRSGPEWSLRFGRRRVRPEAPHSFCPEYMIETYLDYQGTQASLRYDPNSLLYISKVRGLLPPAGSQRRRWTCSISARTKSLLARACGIRFTAQRWYASHLPLPLNRR